MNKEELKKRVAVLEGELKKATLGDTRIREEFAKAFNWYEPKGMYDSDRKLKLPTWEEIFVALGKKLVRLDCYDMEGNISELKCAVDDIKKAFTKQIEDELIK